MDGPALGLSLHDNWVILLKNGATGITLTSEVTGAHDTF